MARVRLATRSIPEPLCSLSSWCSGYRFVLPSGFGKFITLGTDGFPGGPGWSWLSTCRLLHKDLPSSASALGPGAQVANVCKSESDCPCQSVSGMHWDTSPAMSLFLAICQLGLWPCLSWVASSQVFSLSSSSNYIHGRWGSCAKLCSFHQQV